MTRWLTALVVCLGFGALAGYAADDDGPGKGKRSKGAKESQGTIQIDLSKLPPDLARLIADYVKSKEGKGKEGKGKEGKGEEAKGKVTASKGKGKTIANLPPGLARKPANHPGRVAWLRAHGGGREAAPSTPGKAKGKKGKD